MTAAALAAAGIASAKTGDLVFRPAGAHGPLVRYDLQGTRRLALPAGMLSADGRVFANVTRRKLTVFDAVAGRALRDAKVPPRSRVEAISATGRWIVVRRGTSARVVDGLSGRTRTTLSLPHAFDVDTISRDARSLFLIHHQGGVRYAVVRYDLVTHRLLPKELVQKGGDEKMAGTPAGVVASPDGRWQYTLYRHDAEHSSFVHALELANRYTICLDLPETGSTAQLRAYALALNDDGSDLFAANPALGVFATFRAPQLRKPDVVRFRPAATTAPGTATVSPDGRLVAFAAGRRIWIFDVATQLARGPYDAGTTVLGLAFAGRRVYAAHPGGRVGLVSS